MEFPFAPRAHCEANGQAAYALVVSLLDVLARKTEVLKEGEVALIVEDALRRLPKSPHPMDELARELVSGLRGKFKRPESQRGIRL